MSSHRSNRYQKLKSLFTSVQHLIDDGHKVEWDGSDVPSVKFYDNEICLAHGDNCVTSIASLDSGSQDLSDMKLTDLKKELQERLVISKVISNDGLFSKSVWG